MLQYSWRILNAEESTQNEAATCLKDLRTPIVNLFSKKRSLEKTRMLGKIEGKRRRRRQKMRWLDGITDTMDMNLSKLCEMVKDREAWRATIHEVAKSWTQLSD